MDTRRELYKKFQEAFPLESLPEMPIEKYSNLNRSDSFCYWLVENPKRSSQEEHVVVASLRNEVRLLHPKDSEDGQECSYNKNVTNIYH